MPRKGLYANIAAKRRRIKAQKAAGKKTEKMRKPGTKGAPTAKAFRAAAKTAKKGTKKK
jgi:cysteine sulfinate desulfinase/cysteine desulfurase-like protein